MDIDDAGNLPDAVGYGAGLVLEASRVDRRQAKPTPITTEVTDSEQEMADAFVKAGLLPEEFDVKKFFTDDFNGSVPTV